MRKSLGNKNYIYTQEKSYKQKFQEALELLEKKMDQRDKVFEELKKVEDAGHGIPVKYANDPAFMLNYETYKVNGPWRNNQKVVLKVRETAKKIAKKH